MERLFQSSILGCWLLLVVVQGYTISPNHHHHRPKASVQRTTTTTTLGLSGNNNDLDDSSAASQKIQEMAAFVSVGLLQSVVKEMTNTNMDRDEVSDQTIQAMDRLTRALQMGGVTDEETTKGNTETKTANTKIASLENDMSSVRKEETDTDTQSSFTNEAAVASESATTNNDVLLDDEKVNEKIVDEKLESLLSGSENDKPVQEQSFQPEAQWSPLEVVASNVAPLRSSSIPKKKDPPAVDGNAAKPLAESDASAAAAATAVTADLVENKEENQQEDAAAKQELFQRSLLAQKLEYDAQAIDRIQKQTEETFQRKLLAKQLEQQLKEIDEAAAVDRQRAEESFQRKLLEQTLVYESLADEQEKQQAEETFRRKLLEEAIRYQSLAIERLEERQKAQEEVFRRKLLAEATRYQSQAVQRIQVADEIQAAAAANTAAANANANSEAAATENTSAETLDSKEWVSSLPTITQERYAREAKISHSFPIRDFNPTKWSTNNHFQTIVGTLFRKEAMYSKGAKEDMGTFLDIVGVPSMATDDESRRPLEEFEWDERFRVETKDGDFYVADWKYARSNQNIDNAADIEEENPVCLICHGLESCSDSEIVKEIAIACNIHGIDAACLNFRGCHDSGESCNLTPRGYHLGFTDDLMLQIEQIHSQNPNRRIYLSGFSLGAGVVTKLLGELGPKAYEYNVCGAAVNAVPFDCGQNHMAINGPGITKSIYGDRLLASMKTRLSKQYEQGGFQFDKDEIEKCKTIMDFENLCIAPIFGFDDALDYYDKVKTIDKLHKVCVPQYVIQAKDDPFFKGLEQVNNDESIPINVQYTEYGGHCGYILHQRQDDEVGSKTSWMPRQLGRFFQHLEETRNLQPDQAELTTLVSSETPESTPVTMS